MSARPAARSAKKPVATRARRLAHQAWNLLHADSTRAIALAEQALALAGADPEADAWARLARGFHLLYFATPEDATTALAEAQGRFDACGDRAGAILAGVGMARAQWRNGRFRESLGAALELRDEGLHVLHGEQRGVLLNTIAGCYSSLNQPEQAFAYMYQALRDSTPAGGHGFDAVLHCNLANELLQLGDYHEALRHVNDAIARCAQLNNPRLLAVSLINRIVCLTELGRAVEALPEIQRVRSYPTDATGRGALATHYETMAIAALRAREQHLGAELVALAGQVARLPIPDEHVELAVAGALLARERGAPDEAIDALKRVAALAGDDRLDGEAAEGLSLRVRCLYFQTLSELYEQTGEAALALEALRRWQQLHVARAHLAARARYQAAALHTEILRMQHKVLEHDAQRRATERARAELEAVNHQLSRKIAEVQALENALRQQASRDELTGLFNRRHLNAVLPGMWALAQREQRPLAVVIVDLDHFKQINDRYGHLPGDRLLAAFGELLNANSRKSDVACRYGGEEFCLLMPRTDAVAARRKAQSLLRRWREQVFELGGKDVSGLTFSAGVADSQTVPDSVGLLLKAADETLLDAKRLGRNRVLLHGGPVHSDALLDPLRA